MKEKMLFALERARMKLHRLRASLWKHLTFFEDDEEGLAVIEVLLLIVVVIGLVLIFRKNIESMIRAIFSSISSKTGEITNYSP